ncbi:unnamed protein product [Oppiella nova]|uniref:Fibroblast growth factor n=1 Tax=Oppiella nova TaxID=334625 RepID=A0A7R9Q9N3_9ACAR|nr:unnamed protein product [Oppiella nova]CAG2161369.1 unnamed protein product [Oppiella nova]
MVETRHMFESEEQILVPRVDTRLSLPSVPAAVVVPSPRRQSPVPPPPLTNNHNSDPTHHKRRHHRHHKPAHHSNHNHNRDNYVNNVVFNASDHHSRHHSSTPPTADSDFRTSITTRDFLLYSRCSQQYVSFLHKHIGTTVSDTDRFGIRIKSKIGGVYLCFNNRGRLTTKFDATNIECLFKEVTENRFIKFQSLYNPDWYIGVNKHGKTIPQQIPLSHKTIPHSKRRKCYHFVKKTPQTPSPPPPPDSSHEVLHNYDTNIKPLSAGGSNTYHNPHHTRHHPHKPNGKPVITKRLVLSPTSKHWATTTGPLHSQYPRTHDVVIKANISDP